MSWEAIMARPREREAAIALGFTEDAWLTASGADEAEASGADEAEAEVEAAMAKLGDEPAMQTDAKENCDPAIGA